MGEKKLYRYLNIYLKNSQEMDGIRCYYDQTMRIEIRPDFTLITRYFGIIIIEVKDYSDESLAYVYPDDKWVVLNIGLVPNPYQQLHKYKNQCQNIIDIKGYRTLQVPIIQILALPFLSKSSDVAYKIQNKPQKKIKVMFQEDLDTFSKFEAKLNSFLEKNSDLTGHQMDHINAELFPSHKLPTYSQERIFNVHPEYQKIKLLDNKQKSYACALKEGHRLVFGCAGSGKTVVLIARARYLAQNNPNSKILVLCYNRLLSQMIKNYILPNEFTAQIEVKTFHAWAKHLIYNIDFRFQSVYEMRKKESELKVFKNGLSLFFMKDVPQILEQAIEYQKTIVKNPESIMYDAILIDEAQDFDESWFPSILKVLKDGENGSLLIACDGMQGIYARKRFTWSSVGIQARGRRHSFTKSYRTSKNVGFCAQSIITDEMKHLATNEDEFTLPDEYNGLPGEISLRIHRSREEEYEEICKILKQIRQTSVLIIFRKNIWNMENHPFLKLMEESGLRNQLHKTWTSNRDGIVLSTMHSAKGLEADLVIIPELDMYTKKTEDRQLLYVGMMRTINKLVLSSIARTDLVSEIEKCIKST
ncbi:MAG: AAA family ATPase [Candidatus Lokiarchaeota archaeon]|nr:AAA family ATPase [Candidatus Lokiarchaeota archaeon]